MSPTFNAAQMKNMIPHINEQLGTFLLKLQDVASSGKSVNIHALVGRLTLDVIGNAFLSYTPVFCFSYPPSLSTQGPLPLGPN